jgi:hypothetical protein
MISKSKSERKNCTVKIDPLFSNGLQLEAIKQDRPKSYVLNWALKTGRKIEALTDERLKYKLDELAARRSAMEVTAV